MSTEEIIFGYQNIAGRIDVDVWKTTLDRYYSGLKYERTYF